MMSRVRNRDTEPERRVRSVLHRMGFRFRLHRSDLPGRPDVVLPRLRKVIYVNGCFWHQHAGCAASARPKSNKDFWNSKLDANVVRDSAALVSVTDMGWQALVIWECETRDEQCLKEILSQFLRGATRP